MKWDELLLINEVKEYIESERAKHIAVIDNNVTNDNNIDQADNTEDTGSE